MVRGCPLQLWGYAGIVLVAPVYAAAGDPVVLGSGIFWGAVVLIMGLVVALVTGRRWAWVISLLVEISILGSLIIERDDALALGLSALRFGLLVSSPVRRYVFDRPSDARAGIGQPAARG
jgi:hypothetical protein